MRHPQKQGRTYVCPMHPEVREPHSAKCAKCHMDLIPEGARFGMLRHMIKSPLAMIAMAIAMVAMAILML